MPGMVVSWRMAGWDESSAAIQLFHLVDLIFEEADVVQGQVQDSLHGYSQAGSKAKLSCGGALQFASVVQGVGKVVTAEFV